MKNAILVLAALLATPALASAQTPAQKAEIEKAKSVASLSSVGAAFAAAMGAGQADAVSDLYTQDAVVMPPNGAMVKGRTAIVTYWKGMLAQGKVELEVSIMAVAAQDAIGYDAGQYALVITAPDGQQTKDAGKYLTVLKRGDDGKWRLAFDMWNSDLAAQ